MEDSIKMRDQVVLNRLTLTPDSPKGAILFVHGLGEHIGRYTHYFQYFNQHGFACMGFDLRGHGNSEGKKGHIDRYEDFLEDVGEMLVHMTSSFPGVPVFLYGHSMGGNIALNYILRNKPSTLNAGIITSPWLELRVKPDSFTLFLARVMQHLFPAFSKSNNLNPAHLSHDPTVEKEYKNDPLVHNQISSGCFMACSGAGKYALDHASELSTPVLFIHGGKDPITSPSATASFVKEAGKMASLKIFDGMLHETHHEIGKEKVYEEVLEWIKKHL
jgi:alpha-beta hydrolase superfamily lysophospholipase